LQRHDGTYQLLNAAHVFRDYQFSTGTHITLPPPEVGGA
jgi:hypothetical protein